MVLFVSNFSFAVVEEKKQSTGFKTYTNPDYNIKIEYPKNWKTSEKDLPDNTIVQFTAPDAKDGSETAGLLISDFNMPNGTSLDEFVNFFFKER